MSILKYVPDVLKEIIEIQEICKTEDEELKNIKNIIGSAFEETIVTSASEYGIERYENIYKILSQPTDTLESRRKKIIYKTTNRLPYSMYWLYEKLDSIAGENNYTLIIDYDNFDLLVNVSGISTEELNELKKELKFILPVNLIVDVKIEESSFMTTYYGGYVHTGTTYSIVQK